MVLSALSWFGSQVVLIINGVGGILLLVLTLHSYDDDVTVPSFIW